MDYLNVLEDDTQYWRYEDGDSFHLPNMSSFFDDGKGRRTVRCTRIYRDSYNVGDVVMYDTISRKFVFARHDRLRLDVYKPKQYIPVAVIVIPPEHDIYGTGEFAAISLLDMNSASPDTGGGNDTIPFGGQTQPSGMSTYQQVAFISNTLDSTAIVKQGGFGYVPSTNIYDYFTGETVAPAEGSGLDTIARYPKIGAGNFANSPYLENGDFNPMYKANGNTYLSGLLYNCLSDLNGTKNTLALTNASTVQADWRTAETIKKGTSNNQFPAACCCYRFHTQGTQQGEWYLPSCGEIGYLCARILQIDDTLGKLAELYGSDTAKRLDLAGNYWTSTIHNTKNTRYLYTGIGGIGHLAKTSGCHVRAFRKFRMADDVTA